jgi:hypothetical protein
MTVPLDVATGGLTELAVRARVDAGQVKTVPPAPGRSLAGAGFTRRVLAFTIPAGAATAAAALASYTIARGSGGTGVTARTAALLAAITALTPLASLLPRES